ncbi:hypothetical protein [Demequina iriomotensis]|uniref:hypothetical protein n=1 Tax=Demequina iriomotensis TaxID=1536641 RepID=UPI0007848AB3|nr:hypothetical protein [Demequina iriomotensis]
MIDVELLESMRTAAGQAALSIGADARLAERIAQDVVACLIVGGIAELADPVAHAAACGAGEAAARVHRGRAA